MVKIIENVKNKTEISIKNSKKLKEIKNIENVEKIIIENCPKLQIIENIKNVKVIQIIWCKNIIIKNVKNVNHILIQGTKVSLENIEKIKFFSFLSDGCPREFKNCKEIKSAFFFRSCVCGSLLKGLTCLENLIIRKCPNLQDGIMFDYLKNIKGLYLFSSCSGLHKLNKLKKLRVIHSIDYLKKELDYLKKIKKKYYKETECCSKHQNITAYLNQQKLDNRITLFLALKKMDKIPFDLCRYLISNYL
jgi:hypothetical protein